MQPEVDGELHVGPHNEAALRRLEDIQQQMPGLVETLLACQPHSRDHRPAAPKLAGVYVFTENGIHRYVGRTRNFSRRFGEHVARKSAQNKAAFAFNIARAGAAVAGIALAGTRDEIEALPKFEPHFTAAKQRVRAMEFRS